MCESVIYRFTDLLSQANFTQYTYLLQIYNFTKPWGRVFEHNALVIDLHYKKDIHPSGFRKNLDTFLIPEQFSQPDSKWLKATQV